MTFGDLDVGEYFVFFGCYYRKLDGAFCDDSGGIVYYMQTNDVIEQIQPQVHATYGRRRTSDQMIRGP